MIDSNGNAETGYSTSACLLIEGRSEELTARYSLRWVDTAEGVADPVLYRDGRRVVQAWSLRLQVTRSADPHGGNANTQ